MRTVAAPFLAFALAGCSLMQTNGAQGDDETNVTETSDGFIQVQGDDLARIVRGRGLAWGHDGMNASRHRIVELFCRDGRWFHLGGAEPVSGRYTLSRSALCVQTDMSSENQSCREMRRDSLGRIFTIDLPGTGASPYPVTSYDYAGGERELCGE